VKRLLAVACMLLAVATVPGTWGASASGAELDAYGWWNRNQALPVEGDPTGLGLTTVPTVPAPPTVPADGLYVSNDASGPAAIAAVRHLLGGQGSGVLTLELAEGSTLTGAEEIVGCPVLGGFEAAQNGRWDAAPAYDPEACTVVPVASEDGSALAFDVPATFASSLGDISLLVAPAPGSVAPFSLAFAAPTSASFAVTSVTAPQSTTGGTPSFSPRPPVSAAPSFGTPSSPSLSAPSAPSVPSAPAVEAPGPAPAAVAAPAAAVVADDSRVASIASVIALAAIGAALWWLSSRPQRAPRLLGSVGGGAAAAEAPAPTTPPVRGLGRFARPRTLPPRAI
jgi:hypothetical protein